jgi:hypothetical protein
MMDGEAGMTIVRAITEAPLLWKILAPIALVVALVFARYAWKDPDR